MSYTVLARRYRSGTFDEVIGQDHIAQTLKKAISSGRIAHAYLFCGTRGTGKTSTARILAKALNCSNSDGPTTSPCGKCESCLAIARGDDIDVIEIDAASNTGVDNIREVIENAQYRPARSRFKVYIIDEVHMLSKSAFNALLKTLEEPPSHVKFILATTEPEKVLPTILSRCQRYDFRNIPTREIAAHLKEICKKEKIKADDDALLLVAKAGAGSMRDSLSLLDRLLSVGETSLTTDMIEQLLGLPKVQLLFDLAAAIGSGDVKSALGQLNTALQSGLSTDSFIAALIDHLRNLLILRTCGPDSALVEVPGVAMEELVAQANRFDPVALTQDITIVEELRRNIRQSQAGRALLDATLVRMTLADQFSSIGELLSRLDGNGAAPRPARAGAAAAVAQKKNSEPARPVASPVGQTFLSAQSNSRDIPVPSISGGTGVPVCHESTSGGIPAPVGQTFLSANESTSGGIPAPRGDSGPLGGGEYASTLADPRQTRMSAPPSASAARSASPAIQAPPPPPSLDDEDDDDLPRPGKVWAGPSLAEMARAAAANSTSTAQPPTNGNLSNVEPVDPTNLPAVWQSLLNLLAAQSPMVHPLLAPARLVGIEEGRAIIRYSPQHDTFVKMLERNGKKDLVREKLTEVLGQTVGVKFEVDAAAGNTTATVEPPVRTVAPSRPAPRSKPQSAPEPPPAPSAPVIKLTPELIESLRNEPLIKSLMDNLGATIVKVE